MTFHEIAHYTSFLFGSI